MHGARTARRGVEPQLKPATSGPGGKTRKCKGVYRGHYRWQKCDTCRGFGRVERDGGTYFCSDCTDRWIALAAGAPQDSQVAPACNAATPFSALLPACPGPPVSY
jgi:hypothetical protein